MGNSYSKFDFVGYCTKSIIPDGFLCGGGLLGINNPGKFRYSDTAMKKGNKFVNRNPNANSDRT